jgi:hypothetical protein
MARRNDLHAILKTVLETDHVYFQPPPTIKMIYPCIIYKRDDAITRFANNFPYLRRQRYQVTVVDQNPDSEIPDRVGELPLCTYDRFYTADNLNHDVFTLFF